MCLVPYHFVWGKDCHRATPLASGGKASPLPAPGPSLLGNEAETANIPFPQIGLAVRVKYGAVTLIVTDIGVAHLKKKKGLLGIKLIGLCKKTR